MSGEGASTRWKECGDGEGEKKGERAATPHVCFSTRRYGDPSAFVTVMGWENTEPERRSSLPRLSGTPALTIILLKEGETALSGSRDFADLGAERNFRCFVLCVLHDGAVEIDTLFACWSLETCLRSEWSFEIIMGSLPRFSSYFRH